MMRRHARSASGLCTDRLTHGAHSLRYACVPTHSLRYSRYSLTQVLRVPTVLTQVRMCAHSLTQVLTVLTVLTQVRMCAHRALATIGQSCATWRHGEP